MAPNTNEFVIENFKKTWAYATETFGVYQPLLSWRSNQAKRRLENEMRQVGLSVTGGLLNDSRIRSKLRIAGALDPQPTIEPLLSASVSSLLANRLQAEALVMVGRRNRPPTSREWLGIFDRMPELLDGDSSAVATARADGVRELPALGIALRPRTSTVSDGRNWQPLVGTRLMVARMDRPGSSAPDTIVMARSLKYLSQVAPQALNAALLGRKAPWEVLSSFVDPLANFDPDDGRAVLSPIGVLDLYRQYFFDFGSFLGPPVEHVWVSPGGSVELFEVHTRRTVEERTAETAVEVTSRAESETTDLDELSSAVSQQNGRSTSLGISASGGFNLGVVSASTSASLNLTTTSQTSQQEAHKHSREQSEKLSNEIRKNFRTTFRTSVETTDTSSRRYVFQNSTDQLINYELKRKMRRVGVQVQHIGTQLCWQFYVDNPGQDLGVAELVHVAKPPSGDSAPQPPEGPATLAPKQTEATVLVPFESRVVRRDPTHDTYYNGAAGDTPDERRNTDNQITPTFTFYPPAPAAGYRLAAKGITEVSYEGSDPEQEQPYLSATYVTTPDRTGFTAKMKAVNFEHNRHIRLTVGLTWSPTQEAQDAATADYESRVAQYNIESQKAAHAEYVSAVRERIRLASNITPRPGNDLREEERTVIYRQLIAQLTDAGETRDDMHVTAELIRSIFDVDKLLYFVAPEWWLPRRRRTRKQQFEGIFQPELDDEDQAQLGNATVLTEEDTVGWGGVDSKRRLNYQITEDSLPARLGASLGWVLQLDGDPHRNAFLNTPWVKAVIPIHPGREMAAFNWLQRQNIEGSDGLDEDYAGEDREPGDRTIRDVLERLAERIGKSNNDVQNLLRTETVFENGFDPLQGGFRHPGNPEPGTPYEVFDQWVEILPTEQVVAVEYEPDGGP